MDWQVVDSFAVQAGRMANPLWTLYSSDAIWDTAVSYTHLRAHETVLDLVCRLLLEKKKNNKTIISIQYHDKNTTQ